MSSRRVEFRLSMPGRGSWDGGWSGAGRNYIIVRTLSDAEAERVLLARSYWYHWEDGWAAEVRVRLMDRGERLPKSDGFSGYDWMVANIIRYGDIREAHRVG